MGVHFTDYIPSHAMPNMSAPLKRIFSNASVSVGAVWGFSNSQRPHLVAQWIRLKTADEKGLSSNPSTTKPLCL